MTSGRRAWVVAAVGGGYLLGSLPVAVAVGRRHGVDPRAAGDGNPGWWNAKAVLGRRRAAPVLAGDTLKGVAAGLLGRVAAERAGWPIAYGTVGAAMAGHAWPVLAGFRGGRSVLVFVGGMTVVSPVAATAALGACAATALATRDFGRGARLGVAAFPVLQLLVEPKERVAATGALMSLIGLRFATAARAGAGGRSGPATSAPGAARPG